MRSKVTIQFGILKNVDIRNIWPSEPNDFTPWLVENIDKLGEAIGLDIEVIGRETSVGEFSADIFAVESGSNRKVIIENQYGTTDHRHLGQIITYSAGLGAGIVIWVSEKLRDEHKAAIDWLNQNTNNDLDFYGIEIEAIQIDDSRPAFNFKIISFPNQWVKDSTETNREASEVGIGYQQFFQQLIDELRETHRFTNARSGQPQNWYTFSSQNSRVYKYCFSFASGRRARTDIYIDTGDAAKNKRIFDELLKEKELIEREMGEGLAWERLDSRRASRISIYKPGSIDMESEELMRIKGSAIESLIKLKQVFPKYIDKIVRTNPQPN
jgi:Domain of unknown function (DUF4268)